MTASSTIEKEKQHNCTRLVYCGTLCQPPLLLRILTGWRSNADIGKKKKKKKNTPLLSSLNTTTSSTANSPSSIVQERLALEDIDVPGPHSTVTQDVYECTCLCAHEIWVQVCALSHCHAEETKRELCPRRFTSLTNHEAHELVRQNAGADERHPQTDVKLPGALRLHPHEQAERNDAEMKNESRKKKS